MENKFMKAAVLYAPNDLRYEDYPMPELCAGSVKVRVRAAGICGSDIPRVLADSAFFYPIVLGHEFSGDIVEIGEGVTGLAVGDTVSGAAHLPCYQCDDCLRGDYGLCRNYSFIGSRQQGCFAEYVVLPACNAISYNPIIPYDTAVLFEPITVAIHGLRACSFEGGDTVAILGGGTIGIFAAQCARLFGATKIAVFDIDRERLALAKKMGADAVFCTADTDFKEQAHMFTQSKGFHYLFETAGRPETMQMAFELAGSKATICFIGFPHVPVTFSPQLWENMNLKELKLVGSRMSYTAPFPGKDWTLTAHFLAQGQIKTHPEMIFQRFRMEDAAEAFNLFKTPGQVKGKILLTNDLSY